MPGGFLGVDVFFVLSGFLISTLLLQQLASRGKIDFKQFYIHRARRLLPALLLTIALTAVLVLILARDGAAQFRHDAVASFAYVTNWGCPRGAVVLPGNGSPAAAAAPVVTVGGGAVLPAVADRPGLPLSLAWSSRRRSGRAVRRARLHVADGGAVDPVERARRRGRQPVVLRHRLALHGPAVAGAALAAVWRPGCPYPAGWQAVPRRR